MDWGISALIESRCKQEKRERIAEGKKEWGKENGAK
jgi:hypothetical protein